MKKHYLKKICFYIENIREDSGIECLKKILRERGVLVEDISGVEGDTAALQERAAAILANTLSGTLYVTDSASCLQMLVHNKIPALAWLHEGNRGQNLSLCSYAVENPAEIDAEFLEKVYRREVGIAWDILETDRCLVREMIPEDAPAFAEIYKVPAVSRFAQDFQKDVEAERRYIREYQENAYRYYEYGVWSILLKETGEVIGRAGFFHREGEEIPELGYTIGVNWQKKGLAYEVCAALLRYAKDELGFAKVQLRADEANTASLGLARKLGFVEVEAAELQENSVRQKEAMSENVVCKVFKLDFPGSSC